MDSAIRLLRIGVPALCGLLALAAPGSASAQTPPAPASAPTAADGLPARMQEFGFVGGGGEPVVLAGSLPERNTFVQTAQWTYTLMGLHGPTGLRGQLRMGVEVVPLQIIFQTQRTYGVGFSPIFFQWLTPPIGRVTPFLELLGGAIITNHRVPEGISTFNYTAQGGGGLRIAIGDGRWLLAEYRLHHISNGGLGPRTRSLNSNYYMVGVTFRR
jgi:hypothetical protein